MSLSARRVQPGAERLVELTEELLDAHCDTVCLAESLPAATAWIAHIEYLKDLQRAGQRTLAELRSYS